jgi:hypothetical protein
MADRIVSSIQLVSTVLLEDGDIEGRKGDWLCQMESGRQRIMRGDDYARLLDAGLAPAMVTSLPVEVPDAPVPVKRPKKALFGGLFGKKKAPVKAEPPAPAPAPEAEVSIPINSYQIDRSEPVPEMPPDPDPAILAEYGIAAPETPPVVYRPTPRLPASAIPPAPLLNPPKKKKKARKGGLFGARKRAEAPVSIFPEKKPEVTVTPTVKRRGMLPFKKKKKIVDLGPSFKWREPEWI